MKLKIRIIEDKYYDIILNKSDVSDTHTAFLIVTAVPFVNEQVMFIMHVDVKHKTDANAYMQSTKLASIRRTSKKFATKSHAKKHLTQIKADLFHIAMQKLSIFFELIVSAS